MGIEIEHYHTDNGIFEAKARVKECTDKKQGLVFFGVNAHHQNGIAEKKIRWLQEITRTSITHDKHKWPGAITRHI